MSIERENLSPDEIEKVTAELRTIREWLNGPGAPYELINSHNFQSLSRYAPETLEVLRKIAEGNFKFDQERLVLREEFPEAWNWPDEKEKIDLFIAAISGRDVFDATLESLKEEHLKRFRSLNRQSPGFRNGDE